METAIRTKHIDSPTNTLLGTRAAGSEPSAATTKMATAKKPKEKPVEPKKSVWQSVFFGLATGVLGFLIKVLPEKIGNFLSQIFSSMVKADNPFIPEAK